MGKVIAKYKMLFCVILAIMLSFSSVLFIDAENQANDNFEECNTPDFGADYYNNTTRFESKIQIENGVVIIGAEFYGLAGVTTSATIESKIQRKILFWWFDVNNGQTNNTWVDTFSTWYGRAQHTLGISESGSYRAVIKYTISGSGGSDDIIEDIVYP